jgi:hypothetical protein
VIVFLKVTKYEIVLIFRKNKKDHYFGMTSVESDLKDHHLKLEEHMQEKHKEVW